MVPTLGFLSPEHRLEGLSTLVSPRSHGAGLEAQEGDVGPSSNSVQKAQLCLFDSVTFSENPCKAIGETLQLF